jgi:hypothetical protein
MLVIKGNGCPFAETGTEGVFWAIVDPDPSKGGYDNLYILKDGDILIVFDRETSSKVL